jgi:hypothetical protein
MYKSIFLLYTAANLARAMRKTRMRAGYFYFATEDDHVYLIYMLTTINAIVGTGNKTGRFTS